MPWLTEVVMGAATEVVMAAVDTMVAGDHILSIPAGDTLAVMVVDFIRLMEAEVSEVAELAGLCVLRRAQV